VGETVGDSVVDSWRVDSWCNIVLFTLFVVYFPMQKG
jgi:hypothetical protein